MEFIVGFSLLLVLFLITLVTVFLKKRLSNEFALLPMFIMLVADATFAGMWYLIASEMFDNIKMVKLGIAAAFMVATLFKTIYFLIADEQFRRTI